MECPMNTDKAARLENPRIGSEASLGEAGNSESVTFPQTNIPGFSRRESN
jgi:hypothetical protein